MGVNCMEIKPDHKIWAIVTIAVAVIGCFGILGAALINTLPEILRPTPTAIIPISNGVIPSATAQPQAIIENTPENNSPVVIPSSTSEISPISSSCFDWDKCWSFDNNAKTMTWIGASNGDIGFRGEPLTKLQSGYTAIINISVTMTIEICKGTLDGVELGKDCNPQFLTIETGTHRITSPGNQGGFRAYPK
jgi:hypothetical protein